jgi:Ca2+-transporting ATPase
VNVETDQMAAKRKKPARTKSRTRSTKKLNSPKVVETIEKVHQTSTSSGGNNLQTFPAWDYDVETCLDNYDTDLENGLSTSQANALLKKWGPNSLDKEEKKTIWELLFEQFDDPLVKILLGAAFISFFIAVSSKPDGAGKHAEHAEGVSPFVEPGVILLILIINAAVGVWQESNAESALEALKDMQPKTARVWRDGKFDPSLLASQLVPGDIVHLQAGDMIPADCRILELKTTTFGVEQASLTGESVVVFKEKETLENEGASIVIQDKHNMAFSGTTCASGEAIGVVQATGMRTEFGQIQAQIQQARQDTEDEDTPLGAKLKDFGEQLTLCIGVVCLLVWIIKAPQFLKFNNPKTTCDSSDCFKIGSIYFMWRECLECFKIAVALAVAAIPEGLPAVITTCLALGTRKMAKRNALVRKLPSVETLGCTTVICSDKTGTLTTNKMAVTSMLTVDSETVQVFKVTGSTYDPSDGEFEGAQKSGDATTMASQICALCNDSSLFHNTADEVKEGEEILRDGSPTEAALRVLAEKIAAFEGRSQPSNIKGEDVNPASDMYNEQFPRICKLEFNRRRKSMSVLCSNDGGATFDTPSTKQINKGRKKGRKTRKKKSTGQDNNILFVKGAPESVLDRCSSVLLENGEVVPMNDDIRDEMNAEISELSNNALRCIGLAYNAHLSLLPGDLSLLCDYDGSEDHPAHEVLKTPGVEIEIESDLVFVGVAGMRDPPRAQVRDAIQECRTAGVRVIVITGDNQGTAEAICTQIGLFEEGADLSALSFVGHDFASMSEERQLQVSLKCCCYCCRFYCSCRCWKYYIIH